MSVPPTSSSSTTQPSVLSQVGSISESMLSAAHAMTSSLASTSAVSSASQCSAETLLAMLERPSTSLSQPVDVVPETQDLSRDFEVIIYRRDPTVTSRPFVKLCDPTAVTLPLHSTPLEPSVLMKYLLVFELNMFYRFLVILQTHMFFHHSFQHHNHRLHLYIRYRLELYTCVGDLIWLAVGRYNYILYNSSILAVGTYRIA